MLSSSHNAWQSAPLPALGRVGKVVRSLCQSNARGAVIMRFERCVYLQFDEQLVCIGLSEIGASSISGLFENTTHTLPQCLAIGASAQLSKEYLLVDDQYYFNLLGATLYASVLHDYVSLNGSNSIRQVFLSRLSLPPTGFAPLLQHIIAATYGAGSASNAVTISTESELLRFAMPAIDQLVTQIRMNSACAGAQTSHCEFDPALFQKIIGAGPGLTPSGDDFLCGVFIALRLSGFSQIAMSLWASIRTAALHSTTLVSVAMLEQSVLGESGERLEEVVRAYYDYPLTATKDFQQLVDRIGESSGWDWLTGFVLCIDILWCKQIKIPGTLNLN